MNYSIKCFADFCKKSEKPMFIRCIGTSYDFPECIGSLDRELSERYVYKRLSVLSPLTDSSLIKKYKLDCGKFCNENSAFSKVLDLYRQTSGNRNVTIEQNFVISVMYWYDTYLKDIACLPSARKLVYCGKTGYKEYLFLYFAVVLGIDVLLILPEKEPNITPLLLKYSVPFSTGFYSATAIPPYDEKRYKKSSIPAVKENSGTGEGSTRKELSYEETARLAESVVMIAVLDRDGEVMGNGSGIVISKNGYILTNCHVIAKGYAHIVRFENDEKVYPAQIIKYHPDYDMAVARIEKTTRPLPIYSGKKLLRGQKVVAIGSPMGLMNTVSDGIISGFRTVNEQEMIQFTAPISNGSSGGALLNMYGEVIGMSTASISKGQNMNLAVNCNDILPFIRNFI